MGRGKSRFLASLGVTNLKSRNDKLGARMTSWGVTDKLGVGARLSVRLEVETFPRKRKACGPIHLGRWADEGVRVCVAT
jgi:hypothetical protein